MYGRHIKRYRRVPDYRLRMKIAVKIKDLKRIYPIESVNGPTLADFSF